MPPLTPSSDRLYSEGMDEQRGFLEEDTQAGPRLAACLARIHAADDPTRARIEQLATAFVELGHTEDEALSLAIRQVETGEAETTQAAVQTRPASQSAKQATALALLAFSPALLALNLSLAERLEPRVDSRVTYTVGMLVVPLLAGLFVGLTARRKPVRGVVNAIALLTVPALMLPGLIWGFYYAFLPHGDLGSKTGAEFAWRAFINVTGFPYWLALGSAGAALGAQLRRLVTRPRKP